MATATRSAVEMQESWATKLACPVYVKATVKLSAEELEPAEAMEPSLAHGLEKEMEL